MRALQEWHTALLTLFPSPRGSGGTGTEACVAANSAAAARRLIDDARYAEGEVDAARRQWEESVAAWGAPSESAGAVPRAGNSAAGPADGNGASRTGALQPSAACQGGGVPAARSAAVSSAMNRLAAKR